MDGHEDPYIVAGNRLPLEAGMAFSIEPGIYVAGHHGARIEDIVVCTPNGVRRLNNRPTDLVYLCCQDSGGQGRQPQDPQPKDL